MRINLIPREERFFDMFDEAAAILTRAAGKFLAMVKEYDRLEERGNELKFEEHASDEAVERIIKALDRSFITPSTGRTSTPWPLPWTTSWTIWKKPPAAL